MDLFQENLYNFDQNNASQKVKNILDLSIENLLNGNLYHLKSDVETSQNGYFGTFTQSICLRGGKTKEQIKLIEYMNQNNKFKFDFNKFHIHHNGKPYELWGYLDKKHKTPFILSNRSNIYDKVLLSEEEVIRFFT